MMEHVRAAVIDLDGTLLDTAPDFHAAINAMRAEFALAPLDVATIVSFVGKGSENLVRRVLAQDFDDNAVTRHLEQAMDAYQRHYLAINGLYSRLYPAVVEGLQALRDKGLRLACVTNKPMAFCVPLLEKMGLRGYFEVVYGGDSFATRKPDPAPVLAVCRDFELSPRRGDRHRRLRQRRDGGPRGGLPRTAAALRLQPRRIRARCRLRWYS
jgi:phosphoglycolate phosphatase